MIHHVGYRIRGFYRQESFVDYHEELLFTDLALFNRKLTDWLVVSDAKRPHHFLSQQSPLSFLLEHQPEYQRYWTHTPRRMQSRRKLCARRHCQEEAASARLALHFATDFVGHPFREDALAASLSGRRVHSARGYAMQPTESIHDNAEVVLDIGGGGDELAAVITNESAENLGLAPGIEAYAMFKASWVIIAADDGAKMCWPTKSRSPSVPTSTRLPAPAFSTTCRRRWQPSGRISILRWLLCSRRSTARTWWRGSPAARPRRWRLRRARPSGRRSRQWQ